jgi:hypothetical protein
MKYTVIELGDCTVGKRKDIIKYLEERQQDLSKRNLGDCGMDLDMYIRESEDIQKTIQELENYYSVGLIKLYRNEFDEMKWNEINI